MHDLGPTVLDALQIALMLSLPALGVAFVVGAGVGLLQAATQLSEPAINAIARLLAVGALLALCAGWMGAEIVRYTLTLWQSLPGLLP